MEVLVASGDIAVSQNEAASADSATSGAGRGTHVHDGAVGTGAGPVAVAHDACRTGPTQPTVEEIVHFVDVFLGFAELGHDNRRDGAVLLPHFRESIEAAQHRLQPCRIGLGYMKLAVELCGPRIEGDATNIDTVSYE
jgi:hypothetical protein